MRVFTDSLSKTLADDTAHKIVFVRKIIDEKLPFFLFCRLGLLLLGEQEDYVEGRRL